MLARFKQTLSRYPSSSDTDSFVRERSSGVLLGSPRASPTARAASALRAPAPWADDDDQQQAAQIQGTSLSTLAMRANNSQAHEPGLRCSSSIQPFTSEDATAAAIAAVESPRAAPSSNDLTHGGPHARPSSSWTSPTSQATTPSTPAAKPRDYASMRSPSECTPPSGTPSGSGRRPPPHPATAATLRAASSGSAHLPEPELERGSSASSSTPAGSLGREKLLPLAHMKKLTLSERVHMEDSTSLSRSSVKPFESEEETAAILAEEQSPAPGVSGREQLPAPWGQEKASGGDGLARGGSITRAWTLPASRGSEPMNLQAGDSSRSRDSSVPAGGLELKSSGAGKLQVGGDSGSKASSSNAQAGAGGKSKAGVNLQAGDSSTFAGVQQLSRSFRAAQLRGQAPVNAADDGPAGQPARRRPQSATLQRGAAVVGVFQALLRRASFGGSSKVVPGPSGRDGSACTHAPALP